MVTFQPTKRSRLACTPGVSRVLGRGLHTDSYRISSEEALLIQSRDYRFIWESSEGREYMQGAEPSHSTDHQVS